MKLITTTKKITVSELKKMSEKMFGNLVKAVVDIEKEIMAIDEALHADEEARLLESGSKQKDLWGVNLYPEMSEDNFIEFDSMINLRPSQGNRSREVDSKSIRKKIAEVINKLVKKQ